MLKYLVEQKSAPRPLRAEFDKMLSSDRQSQYYFTDRPKPKEEDVPTELREGMPRSKYISEGAVEYRGIQNDSGKQCKSSA